MKERIFILDELRAVAILAVVTIHATGSFMRLDPPFEDLYVFLRNISYFSVGLFFILSSFLLFKKYKDTINLYSFYKNRVLKILIPYIIFSLIYEIYRLTDFSPLYFHTNFQNSGKFIQIFIIHLVKGGSYFHLYFMSVIITFYLIFPILLKFYKKFPLWTLALLITAQFMAIFLWSYFKPNSVRPDWMIVWWLIYISLGLFAAKYLKSPFKKIKKRPITYIILVAGITVLYYLYFTKPITDKLIGSWLYYLYNVGIIILLYLCLLNVGDFLKIRIGMIIRILSAEAFGIYLVHPLVNDLLFLKIILKNNLDLSPISFALYYTIVIISSIFFYYPVKKFVSIFKLN